MQSQDIITADHDPIGCDGGNSESDGGHPLVYLSLQQGDSECPYCGCRYVFQDAGQPRAAH